MFLLRKDMLPEKLSTTIKSLIKIGAFCSLKLKNIFFLYFNISQRRRLFILTFTLLNTYEFKNESKQ